MKKIHAERLRRLAKRLRLVEKKDFDISRWTHACGTPACVGGWACTIPEFRKAGLRLVPDYAGGTKSMPTYRRHHTFDAMAMFFGPDAEREGVFDGSGYSTRRPTPQDAVDKIKDVVKRYYKPRKSKVKAK